MKELFKWTIGVVIAVALLFCLVKITALVMAIPYNKICQEHGYDFVTVNPNLSLSCISISDEPVWEVMK